jgi:hypothetical protein
MPRLPIDYSKTIIYKIVCNDLNITDVYVGSTTDFVRRKSEHRRCCTNEKAKSYNYKVYQTIRCNGGWDNFTMIEIEKYNCNNSNEAHTRERHYYELLNAKLNIKYPNRSKKEYMESNKEQLTVLKKQWTIANKEKVLEQQKKYKTSNIELIKEYNKKYREANKEKIVEQKKQHYEANKEKIAEQKKQQYLKKKALKEI